MTFHQFAIYLLVMMPSAKYLEHVWSSRDLLNFVLLVNVLSTTFATMTVILWSHITPASLLPGYNPW